MLKNIACVYSKAYDIIIQRNRKYWMMDTGEHAKSIAEGVSVRTGRFLHDDLR